MVYKKTYVSKVLTLLLCAVVSLSVFWHGGMVSDAATISKPQETMSVSSIYLAPGVDNCVTVSFSGYVTGLSVGSYQFAFYCAPFYSPSEYQADLKCYIDNVRIVIGGREYPASYQAPNNYLLQGDFDFIGGDPHYTIMVDLHRIAYKNTASDFSINGTMGASGSLTGTLSGSIPPSTYTGEVHKDLSNNYKYTLDFKNTYRNVSFTPNLTFLYTSDIVLSAHGQEVAFLASGGTMKLGLGQQVVYPVARLTQQVTDNVQQDLTQQQTDAIKDQTQQQQEASEKQLEEQQKQTAIQEEQKETTKGIFGKITSFFDGFGDMVKGFFVPSSDELMAFLDEVNTWFGDRLGFIYYPFDLAVTLVRAYAMGDANQQFMVPGLTLNLLGEQYTIWQSFTVDLDAMGIFTYVRYFTSAILCLGVGKLAVSKWDDWIGGKRG